jgi:DnaJ homologue, subfamily C, member 28, conserved domain
LKTKKWVYYNAATAVIHNAYGPPVQYGIENKGRSVYLKKQQAVMIPGFEKLVEDRINKAQRQGEFDNLPGAGKPMGFEDDRHIPEDLRLAYKILKNADCLPPEIELKKEILRTEDLLSGIHDEAERYRILRKLNFLILKLNASRQSDARFDMPQHYLAAISDRMSAKTGRSGSR